MRLIDADALIEKCGGWYVEEGTESGFIGTLKDLLATESTIQPETHDKRTETHACDCVSRQAAIDAIADLYWMDERLLNFRKEIDAVFDKIKDLPSVQPEIVPCGDCKHLICHDRRCGYWNHGVKPLEWCCHAERKEN